MRKTLNFSKERRQHMASFIGIVIAGIGAHFYSIDFCTLFTFISIGIDVFKFFSEAF